MKLINLTLALGLAGMASAGCMVPERPYSYFNSTGVAQSGYGYPLYYSDGMYWAYQDPSWYWWANDRWAMASHAPYNPVFVSRPHGGVYGGAHGGVYSSVHRPTQGFGHGGAYGSVHRPTQGFGHGGVSHGGSYNGHRSGHH